MAYFVNRARWPVDFNIDDGVKISLRPEGRSKSIPDKIALKFNSPNFAYPGIRPYVDLILEPKSHSKKTETKVEEVETPVVEESTEVEETPVSETSETEEKEYKNTGIKKSVGKKSKVRIKKRKEGS